MSSSQKTLKSAAPAALRTVINILTRWSCSRMQMAIILDISPNKLYRFTRNPNRVRLNYDQRTRLSYVLNIYQCIGEMFSNPKNIDNFMSLPNHNGLFNGRRPIDLLLEGSIENIRDTYRHIDETSWARRQI